MRSRDVRTVHVYRYAIDLIFKNIAEYTMTASASPKKKGGEMKTKVCILFDPVIFYDCSNARSHVFQNFKI
jgi:hypothetical protein